MRIFDYEISEEGLLPEEFNKAVADKLMQGLQTRELQFRLIQELNEGKLTVVAVQVVLFTKKTN